MEKVNIDRETLVSLLDLSYTNEQLAAYFSCSTSVIKRRKREYDLVGYKTNSKPLSSKELQTLESLANSGASFKDACKTIGKAEATVRKYIPSNLHKLLVANGMQNLKESHRKASFEKMMTPSKESAYILGYLVTDGNISKTGCIRALSKDKELIQHCSAFFNTNILTSYRDDFIYYYFTAKDYRYLEKFKKVTNLIPNKTYSCYKMPEWVIKYIDYFIVGVVNGDGWVYKIPDRNTCEVGICAHPNQLEFFKCLNIYLDWELYYKNNNYSGSISLKTKTKHKVKAFAEMYCNNEFSLSRKSEILLRYSLA